MTTRSHFSGNTTDNAFQSKVTRPLPEFSLVDLTPAPCQVCASQIFEVADLTSALIQKFEELTMIYQFTEKLNIHSDRDSLCRELIRPLIDCVHATTLAIELYCDPLLCIDHNLLQTGKPCDPEWLSTLATAAEDYRSCNTALINHCFVDGEPTNRIIVVPIIRGDYVAGRMIAIGRHSSEEFGTVEADLMRSTSMMLAVHLANQRQYAQLQKTIDGTLMAMVSALEAKDQYTSGHSNRVAELSLALAKDLGLSVKDCELINKSAILHDIGKIGIDDSVLRKPGKLTEEEFELIKRHPVVGYEILRTIGPFESLLPGVLHHHESWNGSGYPHGLAGNDIPRMAQIIAVADAYDAMTSDRPYRKGLPVEKVQQIFKEGAGVQWAPDVALLLVKQLDKLTGMLDRS